MYIYSVKGELVPSLPIRELQVWPGAVNPLTTTW